MTELDVEAGDYIEDDPAAWKAWTETLRRLIPKHYPVLQTEFGEQEAIDILAGSLLSCLAGEHGLYLVRAATRPAEEGPTECEDCGHPRAHHMAEFGCYCGCRSAEEGPITDANGDELEHGEPDYPGQDA